MEPLIKTDSLTLWDPNESFSPPLHTVCWTWTRLWLPLRSARSSLTSSAAMSTCTSTHHPPSRWMIPRYFSPTPAWIRYSIPWRFDSLCGFADVLASNFPFLLRFLVVQAHLPKHHWSVPPHGQASPCGQHTKVYPRRRETQRPGRRWQGCLPSHLLWDAGVLVLWGLLQGSLWFFFSQLSYWTVNSQLVIWFRRCSH